jgi:hypothetical protein
VVVVLVPVVSAAVLAVAGAIQSRRAGRGRAAALAELAGAFERLVDAPAGEAGDPFRSAGDRRIRRTRVIQRGRGGTHHP